MKVALISIMAIALFSFFSCSSSVDGDGDGVVANGHSAGLTNQAPVRITATSSANIARFGETRARTILPDDMGGTACTYYMATTSTTSGDINIYLVDFTADNADNTKGTVEIKLPVDAYTMELFALVPGATAPTGAPATANTATALTASSDVTNYRKVATLSATAYVDLRYNTTVSFYLTANNIEGKGYFDITMQTDFLIPTNPAWTVTASIVNCDTGALVFPTAAAQTIAQDATQHFDTASNNNKLVCDSTAGGIDSGTYLLKVDFLNTVTNKTYTYSEIVIILPNQNSTGNVLIPDILGKPPIPPSDFVASYETPKTKTANQFVVEFAWTDACNKEEGYEIDLMRVDDVVAGTPDYFLLPASDTDWAALSATYAGTATKVFDSTFLRTAGNDKTKGCKAWAQDLNSVQLLTLTNDNLSSFIGSMAGSDTNDKDNGSLYMSSQHLKILLTLDHRFIARIRAVNEAGDSAYTYLTLPTPATVGDPVTTMAAITKGTTYNINGDTTVDYTSETDTIQTTLGGVPFPTRATSINLYRITYNIGDGVFKATDGTSAAPKLVTYNTQRLKSDGTANASDDSVTILTPNSIVANAMDGIAKADREPTKDIVGVTDGLFIELKLPNDDKWWEEWRTDSENGTPYTTTSVSPAYSDAGAPTVKPDFYTGYESLNLFAVYGNSITIKPDVQISNPRDFELERDFILFKPYDDKATKTLNSTYYKTGSTDHFLTSYDNPVEISIKTGDANRIQYIEVQIDKATALRTLSDGTTTAPINYDRAEVIVINNNGEEVYKKVQNDAYSSFGIDLTGWTMGGYTVRVQAYKGSICYNKNQAIRLTN